MFEKLLPIVKSKKGFVGVLFLFYGVIRGIISLLGDVAFVVDYIAPVTSFLASGAGNLVAVILGIFLILWALYGQQLISEPGSTVAVKPEALTEPTSEGDEQQRLTQPPQQLPEDLASASYIKDQTLHIFDLARRRTTIKGKTFEDCDIHGPAVAAVLGGTDFMDCTFAEGVDHSSLVWHPEPNRPSYVGAIGLEECIFRRCNFVRVGLLVKVDYGDQQGNATNL